MRVFKAAKKRFHARLERSTSMAAISNATPLIALDAVVIDT